MKRYTGETLPSGAKIALLVNDALGNFAIATPLAQVIRRAHPDGILDFYGGTRTEELESAAVESLRLYDWRCGIVGRPLRISIEEALLRKSQIGGYDLVVNLEHSHAHMALAALLGEGGFVCGPCLSPDGRGPWAFPEDERGDLWRDTRWASDDLAERYSFLSTGFIGEIFVRLAYLEPVSDAPWPGGLPRYLFPSEAPSFDTPKALISTGGSLAHKLWPMEKWAALLREWGAKPGLIGAPPMRQAQFYHSAESEEILVQEGLVEDLRGKLTLPEVVGAIERAEIVVTLDNGILHFAAAFDKPTVGLYRREVIPLWAPPNPNLLALSRDAGVAAIPVEEVLQAVREIQPLPL